MCTTRGLDVAPSPAEPQCLAGGHGRRDGADGILDMEVRNLAALCSLVSLLVGVGGDSSNITLLLPNFSVTVIFLLVTKCYLLPRNATMQILRIVELNALGASLES